MELRENERIDDLELNDIKIIQNLKYFCFGIDSVLLSDFSKEIKKGSIIADLGTGNGIIPLLMSQKIDSPKIFGIEIQEELVELARRNVELNDLKKVIEIININIKELHNTFGDNFFDAIITNPPYKKAGSGIKNPDIHKEIARHEIECNLEDIIVNAKKTLKNNGSLYMVHRPERIADICYLLKKHKLEPKKMRMVYSNINSLPKLVLIKATKAAKEFLNVEKPLYIYNLDGTYTEEILKIYGKKGN